MIRIVLLWLYLASFANAENVFLFRYLEKEIGEIPPYSNKALDCTSHAGAMAVDILAATQIHMHGRDEVFPGRASPEPIHWKARKLANRNGASGVKARYVAAALRDYGVLFRQEYNDGVNSLDLTDYDSKRAASRADSDVPTWLDSYARQYRVHEIRHMRNGQDVVNEIKAGRPVLMAFSYKFPRTRDADGFTKPYLTQTIRGPFGMLNRSYRTQWKHALVATGFIDGDRPGIVIQNSHGDKQKGPNPDDLPAGAFAVDLMYLDRLVTDWGDCWSIGDFGKGHAAANVSPRPPPKSWIVVLSTKSCTYCVKQTELFKGKPYRIASVKVPKEFMEKWNFSIYPTTVIIDKGRLIKSFQGLTPWKEIEPYARKAKK